MEENGPLYRMTIDLNVLDHLADGLYSSVAAVLTEAVANSWDADATAVKIDLAIEKDKISIADNGIGMDRNAVNEHYLRVGYRRRDDGNTSPGGRQVMGRKGIGKLSLFSISDKIEVRTKAEGAQESGLLIDAPALREAMLKKLSVYNPESLGVEGAGLEEGHGTKIIITALKRERLRDMAPESLRRRLARRFSVIGSADFHVFVNGVEVSSADRDDIKFVEYLWFFGDEKPDISKCESLKKGEPLDNVGEGWDPEWRVRGWVGTVDRPKRLSTPEGNLNSIVILARGRLVDEDVLPRISGAEFYTKYLTGQVEADFLDDSESADIVTSNRQSVIEDDWRVHALLNFLRKAMRTIADSWSELRTTDKTSELKEKYPRVDEWLEKLPKGWQKKAGKLLERIATIEVGKDEEEQEKSQKILLKSAISGFEVLMLRGDAEELEIALEEGVESLLKLLAGRDSLEAAFYSYIVTNRLDVIKKLEQLVDRNKKERVLQEYLFDHLWLLDPAWERAAGSEEMEKRLRLKEPFKNDRKTKKKYGRVDIRYRTVAGKHVIVELKKVSVRKELGELFTQGKKYVKATMEILPPDEKDRAHIEVVFVVGKNPEDDSNSIESVMNGVSPGSRIVTYDLLISRAYQAYAEFLECAKKADRIDQLFE